MTRFPANDPGNAEQIKVGYGPRAVAIDSLGNAWIANTLGHPGKREKVALIEDKLESKVKNLVDSSTSPAERAAKTWIGLYELLIKYPGGDVTMVRPDGTVLPPFDGGKSIIGPWGIAIDGNDNVWVANAFGRSVTHLCGVRLENCPPGAKTGDPISPPGGYIGGLQIITDVAIDPAGNVWVANNWDRPGRRLQESAGAGAIHPLRRQRHSGVLRPGETGENTADWTPASALAGAGVVLMAGVARKTRPVGRPQRGPVRQSGRRTGAESHWPSARSSRRVRADQPVRWRRARPAARVRSSPAGSSAARRSRQRTWWLPPQVKARRPCGCRESSPRP